MRKWLMLGVILSGLMSFSSAAGTQETLIQFYYTDGESLYLYTVNNHHSEPIALPNAEGWLSGISVAPDERYIAYTHHTDDATTLRFLDQVTGEVTIFPKLEHPGDPYFPSGFDYSSWIQPHAWNHNGELLLGRMIWEKFVKGWGSIHDLTFHDFPPIPYIPDPYPQLYDHPFVCGKLVWSPDGDQIAMGRNCQHPGLWLYDLNTGRLKLLIWQQAQVGIGNNLLYPYRVRDLAWSPDQERIAFTMDGYSYWSSHLYVIRPDGTGLQRLTPQPYPNLAWCIFWQDNHTLLYWVDNHQHTSGIEGPTPSGDGTLYRYQLDTNQHTPIFTNFACPQSISPDGQYLLFGQTDGLALYDIQAQIVIPLPDLRGARFIEWAIRPLL